MSRERPSDLQQILTEYNEEHTLRAIRKQHQTAGEARSKTINDFPFGAAIAQVLKDFEFPAHKEKIIEFLQQQRPTHPQSREVLSIPLQIEEQKEYKNVGEVIMAARLVELKR